MNSARLVRLAIRVFWCDLLFIWKKADFSGVAFAFAHLIQVLRLAVLLAR